MPIGTVLLLPIGIEVVRDGHRTNVRYVRGEYSPRTPIERMRITSHSLISERE